jgi:ribonuclease G
VSLLLISRSLFETRVGLVESDQLVEYYIERDREKGITGNIYKGKVIKVLPGMQAAFVDIGLGKAAFLYVADARSDGEYQDDQGEVNGFDQEGEREAEVKRPGPTIQDILHDGQEGIFQIIKEPLGTKGSRITTHISLPGRNLVLMPMSNNAGISRRIESEEERKRLKDILTSIKPEGLGLIARTASEGASEEDLKADMDLLLKLWEDIKGTVPSIQAPYLLHKDLDLQLRAVRDLFTSAVEQVIVDDPEGHAMVLEFVRKFMKHGIDVSLAEALRRKVWLKSGGYIVIDETEALVSIDVNTGRFVGKRNFDDTILKTNLEAVKESVYQIRLRNLGGIIIIDFIDMEKEAHREMVHTLLKEALKNDKAKTNILKISELGLVEMTRKRTRESLWRYLTEPCPYCDGRGSVKSKETMANEILRELKREAAKDGAKTLRVHANQDVVDHLCEEFQPVIDELERASQRKLVLEGRHSFHVEQFDIISEP